eukprot:TRINITY_DN30385_c0_g1_i1.p1 TRINITY_DN30385_c0_g1~~TRINITY_DN30385_c0_g1_i1.p1  ORF type:complete len:447 (+),score=55.87 TRINITY_DN30385_c0_g1_i1:44-1384(+)
MQDCHRYGFQLSLTPSPAPSGRHVRLSRRRHGLRRFRTAFSVSLAISQASAYYDPFDVHAFNASTALDPALRRLSLGEHFYDLAEEYRAGGISVLGALATFWRSPGEVEALALERTVNATNAQLRQQARLAFKSLCVAQGPAPLLALAAGVESRSLLESHVTPECRMLLHVAQERRPRQEVADVGLFCAHSLAEGAQHAAAVLQRNLDRASLLQSWTFAMDRVGRTRESAVTAAVEALLDGARQKRGITSTDAAALVDIPSVSAAEVGVWHADLSVVLLERFPSLRMILVDPYHLRKGGEAGEAGDQGYSAEALRIASSRTQPYRARATHVVQGSVDAAAWMAPGSLDLVFIDGDHSYNGARGDIEAWWPLLREGGVMVGHDYTLTWPGVVRAVDEHAFAQGVRVGFTPEVWFAMKPESANGESSQVSQALHGECGACCDSLSMQS